MHPEVNFLSLFLWEQEKPEKNYTSVDPKQLEKSDAYGTLHAAYHILVAVVLVVVVVVVVVVEGSLEV